jgi:hypothetical protein
MPPSKSLFTAFLAIAICFLATYGVCAQAVILQITCRSCGYKEQFIQGSQHGDVEKNVQHIIVVCERANKIRNIKVPLDPDQPVNNEPLLARQYGWGRSELLGVRLPRFLVPGNTCPLFPISAYIERDICPVDGSPGIRYAVVGGR